MKIYFCCLFTFFLLITSTYARDLTGIVTDAGGNPVKDSQIYLSFTYQGNPYSFFDFISDSAAFEFVVPIRTTYSSRIQLPISGKINYKILNRKSELVRTILINDTLNAGYHKVTFDRLTDDGYLMKDDIYTHKIDVTSFDDSIKFSGSIEKLMLAGLSKNALFNRDHLMQSWATTDSAGQFKIIIDDLPIGLKFNLENSTGSYDSSVVDSLIGIAVVKGENFHYDSIRIHADTNAISMVLDQTTGIAVGSSINSAPDEFILRQNYPNPFNPETIIQFELPKQSRVQITIYNISGQIVRRLVNETKPAGIFSTIWDGRNDARVKVSSGIYLCRLSAGNYAKTNKMLLLK